MGKFDGVLLVSDFDNTLVYTEEALQKCVDMPPVSDKNRAALEYFMANGGLFAVATGRAKPAFETVVDGIPMNGPTVLFNGAAIYDFSRKKYLVTAFLPDTVRAHITQVVTAMPRVAVELYHDDNTIHALNANDVTRRHMHITHAPSIEVDTMDDVPSPISKALFSTEEAHLPALLDFLASRPWYHDYEVVPSAVTLVELTAKGANKGRHGPASGGPAGCGTGKRALRGRPRQRHQHAHMGGGGLCPGQRHPAGAEHPGVHHLPDCRDDAIAALVAELDKRF